MNEFSWRTRTKAIAKMASDQFDILVIGGGITGAGLALDATIRGLKVALAEKRDFAAGTSSRSTKLIHGGLRYLEHFDFALVREGLKERAILSKNAPHLSRPFPFLVPVYADSKRNYDSPLKVRAGLVLYDLLAGGKRIGRHKRISREQTMEIAPHLDQNGLKGAFVYYDGITNDSRLVVDVLITADHHGASIANYVRAIGFTRDAAGHICGATLFDELTQNEFSVKAHIIVNATGIWIDEVSNLANIHEKETRHVRPSKGIHLVVSSQRLNVSSALLIPSLNEHRFYFVVPWEGRVIVGTTDTDYTGDLDSPSATQNEVVEILNAINIFFPKLNLTTTDVISTFAGLRPLIAGNKQGSTTDVSRSEEIFESNNGLISIAGGKLTTYRKMAERAVDLASKRLSEKFGKSGIGPSKTKETILDGGNYFPSDIEKAKIRLTDDFRLAPITAQRLAQTYGSNIEQIEKILSENPSEYSSRLPENDFIMAEIIHAVRHEMAMTVSDVLIRRLRINLISGGKSFDCLTFVAESMARELGWDARETAKQIKKYREEFNAEYAVPPET